MNKNKKQVDYTAYGDGYQVCLPLNSEIKIPEDDPVRLLSAIVERMNIEALIATYSEMGRNEYSPRILMKVCVYGYMRKYIRSRELERACKENVKFMYLLGEKKAPDHNTIARFRSEHLAKCQREIQQEMTRVLKEMGEISFEESAVFIDGTKIESVGNRYRFVWKKSIEKNLGKLQGNITKNLPEMLKETGIRFHVGSEIRVRHLNKLRKNLCRRMQEEKVELVHGSGRRKSKLQKLLETVEEWISRLKTYYHQIRICGERGSYCKTDPEATFMRMKEDHMLNGQLKPGYNVNVASVSEYIVGTYVSADRTDTRTTIPFMEQLRSAYPVRRVVYDSGYESEENYRYFESHPELDLYVKPANYEQRKQKKYRTDISRSENMKYDVAEDRYTCANGCVLKRTGTKKVKTQSGFISEKAIYECSDCSGCPLKEKCIRSKSSQPLELRNKRIEVSRYFSDCRSSMSNKVSTDEGKQLRMNRSIQAEGVFAYIKTDLEFRRFSHRGTQKVGAEWTLLALAYNVLRMHHKALNGRLGTHLYALSPA